MNEIEHLFIYLESLLIFLSIVCLYFCVPLCRISLVIFSFVLFFCSLFLEFLFFWWWAPWTFYSLTFYIFYPTFHSFEFFLPLVSKKCLTNLSSNLSINLSFLFYAVVFLISRVLTYFWLFTFIAFYFCLMVEVATLISLRILIIFSSLNNLFSIRC